MKTHMRNQFIQFWGMEIALCGRHIITHEVARGLIRPSPVLIQSNQLVSRVADVTCKTCQRSIQSHGLDAVIE